VIVPAVSLGEPGDLTGFPASKPPMRLVRVCRADRATWWFSSDGSGRFDLAAPDGTCYLATDAYAAVREATRLGPVSTAWVQARELRQVAPPDPNARLAATTRTAAGRYGVTTELATVVPYALPRRWAAAFGSHGFDGIRHELRHDQRARPSGVALFGRASSPAGGRVGGPAAGPVGASTAGSLPVDDGQRTRLTPARVRAAGVDVFEIPSAASLTIES
jgi:RES domain